jgi:hypothetical protein
MLRRQAVASLLATGAWTKEIAGAKSAGRFFDGVLPSERVETSPARHSVVRHFLVTCLGDAGEIFRRLYAQLRE